MLRFYDNYILKLYNFFYMRYIKIYYYTYSIGTFLIVEYTQKPVYL